VAYCGHCGGSVDDGATFCGQCGRPTTGTVTAMPGVGAMPSAELATWSPRALGFIIDVCLVIVIPVILRILGAAAKSSALYYLGELVSLALQIWFATQLGATGQTPGMRVAGLKCVSSTTGEPIGMGMGVVRWIAHILDTLACFVGWFFPLWDEKRQTFADKILSTQVIVVPKQAFSLT
jgi:uncharacterized RDD family membrane protein YckC